MTLRLILFIGLLHFSASKLYRYKLDTGNPANLCPKNNRECTDGKNHYLCQLYPKQSSNCNCYWPIDIDGHLKKTFVHAHNGIRSKVAADFHIANMNLVYWSRELHNMASIYLLQCDRKPDPCKVMGEKSLSVMQNYMFRDGRLMERWPGYVVRSWYLELGINVKDWNAVLARYVAGELQNFTQLVWPTVEFVGCDAARMFNGVLIVCYYHPALVLEELSAISKLGPPCTACPIDRPTCSKTFTSLCGIDVELDGATKTLQCTHLAIILCICILWPLVR